MIVKLTDIELIPAIAMYPIMSNTLSAVLFGGSFTRQNRPVKSPITPKNNESIP